MVEDSLVPESSGVVSFFTASKYESQTYFHHTTTPSPDGVISDAGLKIHQAITFLS
jgi:hypothetical protein